MMTFKINKSIIARYGLDYIKNNICKNFNPDKTRRLIPNVEIGLNPEIIVLQLSSDKFSLFGMGEDFFEIKI